MAVDHTIDELDPTTVASGDEIPIWDVSASSTQQVTAQVIADLAKTLTGKVTVDADAGSYSDVSFIDKFAVHHAGSVGSNLTHAIASISDYRTIAADITSASGPTEGLTGLVMNVNPFGSHKIFRYDALSIRSIGVDGDYTGEIDDYNMIGSHWNAPTGRIVQTLRGALFHLGAIASRLPNSSTPAPVPLAVGMEVTVNQASGGQFAEAVAVKFQGSIAQKSRGFVFGGATGTQADKFESYHQGRIAIGGIPTLTTGAQFDPLAALDIREFEKLVRTVPISTISGSNVIRTQASQALGGEMFEHLGDLLCTVASANINGTNNGFIAYTPTQMTLGATATLTGNVNATITKALSDRYCSGVKMTPFYDGAATVVRHNYIKIDTPILSNGAGVTDACVFNFDVDQNSHKALAAGTTKNLAVSGGNAAMIVAAWMKVNVAGTILFAPLFASKT